MKRLLTTPLACLLPMAAVCLFALAGCNQAGDTGEVAANDEEHDHAHDGEDMHEHDHGGWWCAPHGVPEEECTRCSTAAAEKAKEEGDWCEEHNRADSQCFICHPENAEEFAEKYRANFGEDPPPLPEQN